MEEIIKTLLLEGIDEATIHRVLDVIEEEYEVVEGVMDDIKAGMNPEKAKAKWVKDQNNKLIDASDKTVKLGRLDRKAWKKYRKHDGSIKDYDTYNNKFSKPLGQARKEFHSALMTNATANFSNNPSTEDKMVVGKFEKTPNGKTNIHTFKKGGKDYKPKKK